ncbi:glutamine amidotransferase-related protein [Arthrobacter sp. SA17]
MLAHQLRHLGLRTSVVRWDSVADISGPDLVVFGPGPGDPGTSTMSGSRRCAPTCFPGWIWAGLCWPSA